MNDLSKFKMKGNYLHLFWYSLQILSVWKFCKKFHGKENSAEEETKRYLIGLKKGVQTSSSVKHLSVSSVDNSDTEQITPSIIVAELSTTEYQQVLNDPNVAYIEEDPEVTIAKKSTSTSKKKRIKYIEQQTQVMPWGIHDIGADVAIKHNQAGQGVKIAVLDTGISPHPDLQVTGGVSFVDGVQEYLDDGSLKDNTENVPYVIKTDESGAVQWEKKYPLQSSGFNLATVKETKANYTLVYTETYKGNVHFITLDKEGSEISRKT